MAIGLAAFVIALATHPQANLIPQGLLAAGIPYTKNVLSQGFLR
jgi:hypothetical protein